MVDRLVSLLALSIGSAGVVCPPAVASPTCTLHLSGGAWEGPCAVLVDGGKVSLSIHRAAAITTGIWRRDQVPAEVWAGTIVVGDDPATTVEIEIDRGGSGAMRTLYGWFPVSGFTAANEERHLDVDTSREVSPSAVDREIVERAAGILSSESTWNRADDRKCPRDATTWSIYCAMEKATIDVAGAFHHRRPALQVVRQIVDERTAGRPYAHRLMDYNNDPSTRLADIRSLFAEAIQRIDAAARPRPARGQESGVRPALYNRYNWGPTPIIRGQPGYRRPPPA